MYFKLITFRWKIWLAFSFVRPVHHKRSKPTKAGSDLIYKKQMRHLRKNLKTDSSKVKIFSFKKKKRLFSTLLKNSENCNNVHRGCLNILSPLCYTWCLKKYLYIPPMQVCSRIKSKHDLSEVNMPQLQSISNYSHKAGSDAGTWDWRRSYMSAWPLLVACPRKQAAAGHVTGGISPSSVPSGNLLWVTKLFLCFLSINLETPWDTHLKLSNSTILVYMQMLQKKSIFFKKNIFPQCIYLCTLKYIYVL